MLKYELMIVGIANNNNKKRNKSIYNIRSTFFTYFILLLCTTLVLRWPYVEPTLAQ